VGKNDGKKLSECACVGSENLVVVEAGAAPVDATAAVDVVASLGLGLIGRSIWSVGAAGRAVGGPPGSILAVLTTAVATS